MTTSNIYDQLQADMISAGIVPVNPLDFELDGKIHRFKTDKDVGTQRTGWAVIHGDNHPAGAFGDWRQGIKSNWTYKNSGGNTGTPYKIDPEEKRKREAHQKESYQLAALEAAAMFESANPADRKHEYLKKKGISSHDVRQWHGNLLVPFKNIETDEIQTLQTITATGDKKFHAGTTKKGAAFTFGNSSDSDVVLVCEGFSTGATLFELTGHHTIVCGDAGNLISNAQIIGEKYSMKKIIVAGDNDHLKSKNMGLESAKEAARIGGFAGVAIPTFGDQETGSDWNDCAKLHGAAKTKIALVRAIAESKPIPPKEEPAQPEPTAKYTDFLSNLDHTTQIPEYRKVGGLFPVGYVSQMISSAGTGKTWLLLKLAADLSTGNGVLIGKNGEQETCFCSGGEPVKTLILAGEAGAEALIRRLRQTGWHYDKNYISVFDNRRASVQDCEILLDTEQGRMGFSKLIEVVKPELVIVDSLFSFHDSKENEAGEMKPIYKFLGKVAFDKNIAVSIAHHSRKSNAATRSLALHQDESIGSNMGARVVASMIGLQAVQDNDGNEAVTVSCLKSWDKKFPSFSFRIDENDTGKVDLIFDLNPPKPVEKKADEIEEFIETSFTPEESFSCSKISKQTGASMAWVRKTLSELVKRGRLIESGANRNRKYNRIATMSDRISSLQSECDDE